MYDGASSCAGALQKREAVTRQQLMTVTLELSAEEAALLEAAAGAAGATREAVLRALIRQLAGAGGPEDAQAAVPEETDPEERRREQAEVEANIKRWHAERAQSL